MRRPPTPAEQELLDICLERGYGIQQDSRDKVVGGHYLEAAEHAERDVPCIIVDPTEGLHVVPPYPLNLSPRTLDDLEELVGRYGHTLLPQDPGDVYSGGGPLMGHPELLALEVRALLSQPGAYVFDLGGIGQDDITEWAGAQHKARGRLR